MKKLLLFILFLFTSCSGTLTNYSLNKLQYGQSKQQVVKLLSNPAKKRILGQNKEAYIYYVHDSILDLFLTKRFPFVGFYPLNRTGDEFWLLFENNSLTKTGDKSDIIKSY